MKNSFRNTLHKALRSNSNTGFGTPRTDRIIPHQYSFVWNELEFPSKLLWNFPMIVMFRSFPRVVIFEIQNDRASRRDDVANGTIPPGTESAGILCWEER